MKTNKNSFVYKMITSHTNLFDINCVPPDPIIASDMTYFDYDYDYWLWFMTYFDYIQVLF